MAKMDTESKLAFDQLMQSFLNGADVFQGFGGTASDLTF